MVDNAKQNLMQALYGEAKVNKRTQPHQARLGVEILLTYQSYVFFYIIFK